MPGKKIEISDDCLMKQLKLKSYRAFEVVFNRYYAGLYRFALAYLMNRELAEDVVQEVFCSLWTSSLSIPESTHLKSYLYASVKHACLDYFKHLQVIDINQDKLTEALIFSGTIEYEDNEDLLEKVKACLDKLPEQQRRVLELKVFRDMSYREINLYGVLCLCSIVSRNIGSNYRIFIFFSKKISFLYPDLKNTRLYIKRV